MVILETPASALLQWLAILVDLGHTGKLTPEQANALEYAAEVAGCLGGCWKATSGIPRWTSPRWLAGTGQATSHAAGHRHQPSRFSQLNPDDVSAQVPLALTAGAVDYVTAILGGIDGPNAVLDLHSWQRRVPERPRQRVARALVGEITGAGLDNVAATWNEITDRLGQDSQRQAGARLRRCGGSSSSAPVTRTGNAAHPIGFSTLRTPVAVKERTYRPFDDTLIRQVFCHHDSHSSGSTSDVIWSARYRLLTSSVAGSGAEISEITQDTGCLDQVSASSITTPGCYATNACARLLRSLRVCRRLAGHRGVWAGAPAESGDQVQKRFQVVTYITDDDAGCRRPIWGA
ncbi:MAG: hypothetical protein U0452_09840 [Anaerolineae bacterium]